MTEKSTDYILEQLSTLNCRISTVTDSGRKVIKAADNCFDDIYKTLNQQLKTNKHIKRFNRTMFIFSAACCAYIYFNEKKMNKLESEMKELKNQKGD